MSCCAAASPSPEEFTALRSSELVLASKRLEGDEFQTDVVVPVMHCAACMSSVERLLVALPGVTSARVNLSTKRVAVRWKRVAEPPPILQALAQAGFEAHLFDIAAANGDPALRRLVKALAVAGFATSNIMLLSVAVWSGADPQTRDMFHWISAAIALVTVVYSGQPFFASAWSAVRSGRANMDVPISVGVILTYVLSLIETLQRGQHAYFDAAVSLLFVLLVGRTLDYLMREKTRTAVASLARLIPRTALVVADDGSRLLVPIDEVEPGSTVVVRPGERVPLDGIVSSGETEVDYSLLTGESTPVPTGPGDALKAGTQNLGSEILMRSSASAGNSWVAELLRHIELAEEGKSSFRGYADRAARLYAPVVHLTAAAAFVAWFLASGDIRVAATIAVAVLIITCPCALGLAVPMVQVVAAQRLFQQGILVKNGDALERLANTSDVVFDKTGTLTVPALQVVDKAYGEDGVLGLARQMAQGANHPYAAAIAAGLRGSGDKRAVALESLAEVPGCGVEATVEGDRYRLGKTAWALDDPLQGADHCPTVLSRNGEMLVGFSFEETLRDGTAAALSTLANNGLGVHMVSGDRHALVGQLATTLGVPFVANALPLDKVDHVQRLALQGHNVLMVGDGINDLPAMAAAHTSMAPASAADAGRKIADLVFLGSSLMAVPAAIQIARRGNRLIRQNIAIAVAYNIVAVPIALAGWTTPLIAAIAMSLSSLTVVLNALRFGRLSPAEPTGTHPS